ncbi:hypothetical protein BXZ70DRAFT_362628 [Cristinia sonorae]|uniref:F-box domain-containing protein n=1 Tax=Cristinia sonorae TaxID=1940300 RepID=A0A8K0ULI9_9AGAR|nr:hypothetical protein BXZ70DRAFT_362628 [Cristinia sonorae]
MPLIAKITHSVQKRMRRVLQVSPRRSDDQAPQAQIPAASPPSPTPEREAEVLPTSISSINSITVDVREVEAVSQYATTGPAPPNIPRLPVEVYERIIDFCAFACFMLADQRMLHACALTSRDWLPRSRLHLYDYIDLRTQEQFARFLETVQGTPVLGTFVYRMDLGPKQQELHNNEVVDSIKFGSQYKAKPRPSTSWILQVPIRLLPLLPVVRWIQFRWVPTLPPNAAMLLSRFKSSRSVTSLSLLDCEFATCQDFARFLSSFPFATDLILHGIKIANDKHLAVHQQYLRSLPTLKILNIRGISDPVAMESLTSWPAHRSLTRLVYTGTHVAMLSSLDKILDGSARSLRTCTIVADLVAGRTFNSVHATKFGTFDRLDLSQASCLTHLMLGITLTEDMNHCLDDIRLPSSIQCVWLAFTFPYRSRAIGSLDLALSLPWDKVDTDWSDAKYSSFKKMWILMHVYELDGEERERLRKGMETKLTKLKSRVTVMVNYRTRQNSTTPMLWI